MLPDDLQARVNQIKSEADPLAQARLLQGLVAHAQVTQARIASMLGVKPSHISHLLRVLKLPEIVIDGYLSKQLSFTHLIVISRLKGESDITKLYEEILAHSYSIARTEHRVREYLYHIEPKGEYLSPSQRARYESRIKETFDDIPEVKIIQSRIKAKITLSVSGNLQETSEFIRTFGSRFRRRKASSDEDESPPDEPPDETPQHAPGPLDPPSKHHLG